MKVQPLIISVVMSVLYKHSTSAVYKLPHALDIAQYEKANYKIETGSNPNKNETYPAPGEYYLMDDVILPIQNSRAALAHPNTLWPNGIVPYDFHSNVTNNIRQTAAQAMALLHDANPCITFQRFNPNRHKYNVLFIRSRDGVTCNSVIGFRRVINQINVATRCRAVSIAHELMHALGFFHEQTRKDRNKYIRVNITNVIEEYRHNYNIDNFTTSYYGVPYNFDSIMHYEDAGGFAVNPKIKIITVRTEHRRDTIGNPKNMGQRRQLSGGDIAALRGRYKCGTNSGDENNEEQGAPVGTSTSSPVGNEVITASIVTTTNTPQIATPTTTTTPTTQNAAPSPSPKPSKKPFPITRPTRSSTTATSATTTSATTTPTTTTSVTTTKRPGYCNFPPHSSDPPCKP